MKPKPTVEAKLVKAKPHIPHQFGNRKQRRTVAAKIRKLK